MTGFWSLGTWPRSFISPFTLPLEPRNLIRQDSYWAASLTDASSARASLATASICSSTSGIVVAFLKAGGVGGQARALKPGRPRDGSVETAEAFKYGNAA